MDDWEAGFDAGFRSTASIKNLHHRGADAPLMAGPLWREPLERGAAPARFFAEPENALRYRQGYFAGSMTARLEWGTG